MRKVLIANRGEIARRIQRTCREMGIATVAVFSEPDRDAPFVREADEAVALGGASPRESYLRIDALVDAAKKTGADGVHPGYGFLAENAAFARACAEAGIVFIGPTPEAIEAMGSKIEAKRRMRAAGVPMLPSLELGTERREAAPPHPPLRGDLSPTGRGGELARAVEDLGLPLLVKASAGGGGKGMRLVREAGELADAVASAEREAASAFGDATVYLERYLEGARHVEIQIFGDAHGNVIHLYERECSIQRRHQKIVEESPSPVLDPRTRAAMGAAAVAGGKAIGYRGAGTVEFMLAATGEFFFLEVNTRLQVEHPVTEATTGLDLVRLQIEVARGGRLPKQEEIPPPHGHAIEVRLYAEDPENDFLPSTGTLHGFAFDALPGLRVDSGFEPGGVVSPHYDPMLAKVIAWAPSRSEAADCLAAALARARVHGVRTNRALLVRILRHEEFRAGKTDTQFLERNLPSELGAPLGGAEAEKLHAAAAAIALQAARRAEAKTLAGVPSGWRNVPSEDQRESFDGPSGRIDVDYRFTREGIRLRLGGEPVVARLHGCTSPTSPSRGEVAAEQRVRGSQSLDRGGLPLTRRFAPASPQGGEANWVVDLELDGVRRRYSVARVDQRVYVDSAIGSSEHRVIERLPLAEESAAPGSLASPMPGKVISVAVEVGQTVEKGALLVVLEAMKMEQKITAPATGLVSEIRVKAGDQVEAGVVLVVLASDT